MNRLKNLFTTLCVMVVFAGMTSCESNEPGSSSNHDYYSAFVESDGGSYYWVIDMDPTDNGAGYDGTFQIRAWDLAGKRLAGKTVYSGKYQTSETTIYVTWNHQSLNTMWRYVTGGIRMVGSGNPEELEDLTFYAGAPSFN